MKYRVAKGLPMSYMEELGQDFGCPYIEFDSKEQFEHISMTSNSYKMLQAKYDFLFDYFTKLMSITDLAKQAILTDGKIEQRFKDNDDEEEE